MTVMENHNHIVSGIPALGQTSADVACLQERLNAFGYPCGEVDGIFGRKTFAAVKAFQKKVVKTLGSGVIGPMTLKALGIYVKAMNPVTGQATVTQDLKGKKDRHIHPSLRLLLENKIFPQGTVPKFWRDGDVQQAVIATGRALGELGFKEKGGNNKGKEIGWIQSTVGVHKAEGDGAAWCLSYAQIVVAMLEDFYKMESPILDTEHCVTCYNAAKKVKGLTTQVPTPGTIALGQNKPALSGHAMVVIAINPDGVHMTTSEGNTSVKNLTDGDGSGLKTRNVKATGKLSTLGFVFVYPDGRLPESVS